ncbi:hypothetical protein [Bacillus sp. J37]|uniref:hypothetical protein n=1 Tax=Bacillus sp. J37 TaxID=935837 RepID=UPI0004799AFF|nr:hypothetical protein [Bacillus sp. J37]
MPTIHEDQRNADVQLRDIDTEYSLDYYLNVCQITGDGQIELINVYSAFRGYLYIMVDGYSYGRLQIGEGVQNIPVNIEFESGVNFYVRPHETVGNYSVGTDGNYSIELYTL